MVAVAGLAIAGVLLAEYAADINRGHAVCRTEAAVADGALVEMVVAGRVTAVVAIRDVVQTVVVVTVCTGGEMGVTVEAVARLAVLSTERTDRIAVFGTRVAVRATDGSATVSTDRITLGTFSTATVRTVGEFLVAGATHAHAAVGAFTPT